jgi:hypothetical protein
MIFQTFEQVPMLFLKDSLLTQRKGRMTEDHPSREPKPSLTSSNVQLITTVVGSLFLPEIIPAAVGLVSSQTLAR